MSDQLAPPVAYAPALETPEADEAETSRELNETFGTILKTTSEDYGHAVRAVHAKSHGFLEAELVVADGLAPEYAQGLFAQAGGHRAILRFSTNAGDILDDAISLPRGLAIKVFDVAGERLPGSEDATTQDFIMVNGPTFAAAKAKDFLKNLKLLAGTTDKAEWAKKALSGVLRAAEATLEAVGGKSAMLNQMGGAKPVHPLGQIYYSQTPFRYGGHVAKFALFPVSPHLLELADVTINASGRPDAIRENMNESMIEGGGVWELRVQLNRDPERMPIEDSTQLWDEALSPFVTVATITAGVQPAWSSDRALVGDDRLRFSVWTGLAAHRPLGSINRVRKSAYEVSSDYRGRFNGCPMHEPTDLAPLPA